MKSNYTQSATVFHSARLEKANEQCSKSYIVDSPNVDGLKSERSFLETKMEMILNAAKERLYR